MNCICCKGSSIKKKFVKKNYNVFECGFCEFQFVNPIPSQKNLYDFYNTSRVRKNVKKIIEAKISNFNIEKNNPKKDWFNKVLYKAKTITKKERLDILEVGSGYGFFINYCNSISHKAVGTEVTKEYAEASKGIINGEVIYIENNSYSEYFQGIKFDLIYFEHVFEHVMDPVAIITELKKILSKDGVIIITVPNHKSLASVLFKKNYLWMNPPDHLYFYNKKALELIAGRVNLKVIEVVFGDYYHRSIYQFYSMDKYINYGLSAINKVLKTKFRIKHAYKYPRTFLTFVTLLPYLIISPVLKLFVNKDKLGNELTVILKA